MTTLEGVTPYPPEFAARYRALGYWEDRPLGRFFDEVCAQFSERVALVAGEERITYGELASRAERLALHFLNLGLRPRDRLVMQLPNVPEFVYLYLALQKVGVIPVMALSTHRYTEISQFIQLSEAVGYAIPDRMGDFAFTELATGSGARTRSCAGCSLSVKRTCPGRSRSPRSCKPRAIFPRSDSPRSRSTRPILRSFNSRVGRLASRSSSRAPTTTTCTTRKRRRRSTTFGLTMRCCWSYP